MGNHKPDEFSSNLDKIKNLHLKLFPVVKDELDIPFSKLRVLVEQMNYSEYVNATHDNNYFYLVYRQDNAELNEKQTYPEIVVCFNSNYINDNHPSRNKICKALMNILANDLNTGFILNRRIDAIDKLDVLQTNEMLVTVHFLDSHDQIFKVLYPYRTFEPLLQKLK